MVVTRFAPSPTGFMHLGGLRTALFNYLAARKTGGRFLLRIEDTDQRRTVEGAEEALVGTLKWAGIHWSEPIIKQSTRLPIYKDHAERLVSEGKAYRCYCSKERLDALKSMHQMGYDRHCRNLTDENITDRPHVIRLRMPADNRAISFHDRVFGPISHLSKDIEDVILMKADGYPTYHFANVIDDHESQVSLVMRGSEWIPSTPLHLILYQTLNWTPPDFAHLPLLVRQDGSKLSKRHADINIAALQAQGYLPSALLNFVAYLGWTPRATQSEIMDLDQLSALFDISQINKAESRVDLGKLAWINKQHLSRLIENRVDALAMELIELLPSHWNNRNIEYCKKVLLLMKDRIQTLKDIPAMCSYFFILPNLSECPVNLSPDQQTTLKNHLLNSLSAENLKGELEDAFKSSSALCPDLKKSDIMIFYRWLLTGTRVGASLLPTATLLGRDEIIERIKSHQ